MAVCIRFCYQNNNRVASLGASMRHLGPPSKRAHTAVCRANKHRALLFLGDVTPTLLSSARLLDSCSKMGPRKRVLLYCPVEMFGCSSLRCPLGLCGPTDTRQNASPREHATKCGASPDLHATEVYSIRNEDTVKAYVLSADMVSRDTWKRMRLVTGSIWILSQNQYCRLEQCQS